MLLSIKMNGELATFMEAKPIAAAVKSSVDQGAAQGKGRDGMKQCTSEAGPKPARRHDNRERRGYDILPEELSSSDQTGQRLT